MVESRRRRIVKRAVWTVAILVGLLGAYVTSFGVMSWMLPRGTLVGQPMLFKIDGVMFRPIYMYEATDWPGAALLTTIQRWCIQRSQGTQLTWSQASEGARHQREMRRMDQEMRAARERNSQ